MRLRFSLRTLFLLTTVVAALCLWFILPSLTARRFLATVASEDYKSADNLFCDTDDRFLADWAEKRWSLRTVPELLPFTLSQSWHNERRIRVEATYFQFDQSMRCEVLITATPFGLQKPQILNEQRTGFLYEKRSTTPQR